MSQQGEEGSMSSETAGQPAVHHAAGQNEHIADQTRDFSYEPLVTITENFVPGQGRVITEFFARQVVDQYMRQPERCGRAGGGNHDGDRNGINDWGRDDDSPNN